MPRAWRWCGLTRSTLALHDRHLTAGGAHLPRANCSFRESRQYLRILIGDVQMRPKRCAIFAGGGKQNAEKRLEPGMSDHYGRSN